MDSEFDKRLRLYNIAISLLIIGILQLDYFITKDFFMELILNLGISLLLLINILRQISNRIYSIKTVAFIINCLIILTGIYCLSFLLLLKWGFGFSGSTTPYNWTLAFILNLLLGLVVAIELRRKSNA